MKMKKRLIIFCLISFSLFTIPISKPVFQNFENIEDITYYFYTNSNVTFSNTNTIKCGNSFIISCGLNQAKEVKQTLTNVLGESVRIKNYTSKTQRKIKNDYMPYIVRTEIVDDIEIYYCYDNSLSNFVNISNQKVNIQIAIKSNEIDIGYPLILNGY